MVAVTKTGDFVKLNDGIIGKVTNTTQKRFHKQVYLEFADDANGEKLNQDGWYLISEIFAKSSLEEAALQCCRTKAYIKKIYQSTHV